MKFSRTIPNNSHLLFALTLNFLAKNRDAICPPKYYISRIFIRFFDFFRIFNQLGLILCTVFNTALLHMPSLRFLSTVTTFSLAIKRTTGKLSHIQLNPIIVNDIFVQKCMSFIVKTLCFASSYEAFAVQTQNMFSSQPFLPPPPHPTILHAIAQLE